MLMIRTLGRETTFRLLRPAITVAAPATIRMLPTAGAHCTGTTSSVNFAFSRFAGFAALLPITGLNLRVRVMVSPVNSNNTPTSFMAILRKISGRVFTISYQTEKTVPRRNFASLYPPFVGIFYTTVHNMGRCLPKNESLTVKSGQTGPIRKRCGRRFIASVILDVPVSFRAADKYRTPSLRRTEPRRPKGCQCLEWEPVRRHRHPDRQADHKALWWPGKKAK